MRRTLFLLCLPFFASLSFAQKSTHELKTDLFLPAFKIVHLAYEYSPNGRFGFEAGLFLGWSYDILSIPPEGFDPSTPCDCGIEGYELPVTNGIVQISGRYYFFEKQPSAGLYGGLYFLRSFEIWRERKYDQLYEERAGEPPVPQFKEDHLGIGIQAGYKWLLFKKRMLLEPNVGVDFDPRRSIEQGYWGGHRVYFVPTLKLGFRFP